MRRLLWILLCALLDAAALDAERRLRAVVAELRETRDPRRWAIGLGVALALALAATLVALALLKGLAALRRRLLRHAARRLGDETVRAVRPWWQVSGEHAIALLRGVAGLLYRLCAQAMSQLHAHIQDVFNENGVQIMSPHYLGDPPAPQVVPAGPWFSPEAGQLAPPR